MTKDNKNGVVNPNDTVTVTLTEHGYNIYCKYYNSLNLEPPTLENNTLSTELWNLAHIFGSSLYNGSKMCFTNTNIPYKSNI